MVIVTLIYYKKNTYVKILIGSYDGERIKKISIRGLFALRQLLILKNEAIVFNFKSNNSPQKLL